VKLTLLLVAALLSLAAPACAQSWPAKPVRILVGFAPGGSTDLTARIYAEQLNRLWGSQAVVDNRPGASGLIAADLVAKAPLAPEFRKRMLQQGIDQSDADSPQKLAAYLKSEFARWGKVVAEAGVRAE
jgi:tripartite-type tricarboxylate transporter receptor subunit TctC